MKSVIARNLISHSAIIAAVAVLASAAVAHEADTGVSAPGYCASYVTRPNPLQMANGMALDARGNLYVDRVLRNSIVRVHLPSRAITEVAGDYDPFPQQLQGPDDMVFDGAGNLYVTEFLGRQVARISPDGTRVHLPGFVTDGFTAPNGIAFRGDRLFVSDLTFDPTRPGGIWEVDPTGVQPPHPVLFQQLSAPEAFAFAADGLAYVPEFFAGNIAVVDVDAGSVVRRIHVGGILAAVKIDHRGRFVVLQSDTGRVLRGLTPDTLHVIAQGPPGLDNVVVTHDDGLIVSNYLRGNVYVVDEDERALRPLLDAGPLAFPVSLAPSSARDDLWVANFSSVVRVREPHGLVDDVAATLFLGGLSPTQPTLFTPGVVQLGDALFYSDALPPIDQRITEITQLGGNGARSAFARGFALPTHLRAGPNGTILVIDQIIGMLAVTNGAGGIVPLAFGLQSPAGLAYDAASDTVYVSESAAGTVRAINLTTNAQTTVASGLTTPEGVTLDGRGGLFVVEGDAGRLVDVDGGGRVSTVATGLPTRAVGPTIIPGFNLSSDVLVRDGGEIVVSGDGDGSLIRLVPQRGERCGEWR